MSSYNIAIILPTRGLMYAETFKEVLENVQEYAYEIFWSHGNPLPLCFNKPLAEALKKNFTHVWMVEEDMVIPNGTLKALLEADEEIIACDYPLVEAPSCTIHRDPRGVAYFTGTGCLLAKFEVFKQMKQPIFRSDILWMINNSGNKLVLTPEKTNPDQAYGFHDVTFGIQRYIEGKPIAISDIVLAQRKLKKKGENDTNQGADEIVIYDKLAPTVFEYLKNEEEEEDRGTLVEVFMGEETMWLMPETAERFIKEGKAVKTEKEKDYLRIRFKNWKELARII